MGDNLENLVKNSEELFEKGKFNELVDLLNDEVLETFKDARIYAWRARAHYRLKDNVAQVMFYAEKAILIDDKYFMGYYARGNAWYYQNNYDRAIDDFKRTIELNPMFHSAHDNLGNALLLKNEYSKAIDSYNKAIKINPNQPSSFYNRGLARIRADKDLHEAINDFKEFIDLSQGKDGNRLEWAKDYILLLNEQIKDNLLKEIDKITTEIKQLLLVKEGCVTHYTSLSTTKILVLNKESQFRLSEGSFLNDTSEGTELYTYLGHQNQTIQADGLKAITYSPKPFIGSFVAEKKQDDLNLWRFYGKENGTEAQGCAITIHMIDFLKTINDILNQSTNGNEIGRESDIQFYHIAYRVHGSNGGDFIIPNSNPEVAKKLKELMDQLKLKVSEYQKEDKSILDKYLNSIAFLFKSDVYKNENEIRLIIKGIEFEKMIDSAANPPRLYINLVNIRKLIKQITIGPKVDKPDEWAAAFYYSFDKEKQDKPKISISRLPFK